MIFQLEHIKTFICSGLSIDQKGKESSGQIFGSCCLVPRIYRPRLSDYVLAFLKCRALPGMGFDMVSNRWMDKFVALLTIIFGFWVSDLAKHWRSIRIPRIHRLLISRISCEHPMRPVGLWYRLRPTHLAADHSMLDSAQKLNMVSMF